MRRVRSRNILQASLTIVLALFHQTTAESQEIAVRHVTVEDGLPTSNVRSVLKDSEGFLWCGTEEGLLRYDGYSFKTYDSNSGGHAGIPDNRVEILYEDARKNLWIVTALALSRYDRVSDAFRTYRYTRDLRGPVRGFIETRDGALFVLTDETLYQYSRRSDSFAGRSFSKELEAGNKHEPTFVEIGKKLVFCINGNLISYDRTAGKPEAIRKESFAAGISGSVPFREIDFFRSIHPESARGILIVNRKGAFRYDAETGKGSQLLHFNIDCESSKYVEGVLWTVHSNGKIGRYEIAAGRFQLLRLPHIRNRSARNFKHTLFIDRAGGIWFFREGYQALRYDRSTGKTEFIDKDVMSTDLPVAMIDEDDNGSLWLAIPGHGLSVVERKAKRFEAVHPGGRNEHREIAGNTRCFSMVSPDTVLVGTLDGVLKCSTQPPYILSSSHIFSPSLDSILRNRPVWSMARDRSGRYWIGTGMLGLFVFDPAARTHRRFRSRAPENERLTDDVVRTILIDGDTAWIGTWNGLNAIRIGDLDAGSQASVRVRKFFHVPGDSTSLSNNTIFTLYRDTKLRLWVGTENGLNLLNKGNGTFKRFFGSRAGSGATGGINVRAIHEDRPGRLWLGTHSTGLQCFDPATGAVRYFTMENGLPSNIVYSIIEDTRNNLWLGTHKGLCRFNRLDETTRIYREVDGLQNPEFNTGALLKLPDGRLLFGGVEGFNIFNPAEISDLLKPPTVAFTRLLVFGKELHFNRSGVTLPYDRNHITFEFAALSFPDNKNNQYMYMMEGLDSDWVYSGTRRFTIYSNLRPGEYTFRVKASNSEGLWSTRGAAIRVVIESPWWATEWAYGAYGMLFLAALGAVDRIRRKRVLSKERERSAIREVELRFAAAEAQSRTLRAENERKEIELSKAAQLEEAYESLAKAHDNLKTTEDRLRTVVSSAPIVLFVLDPDGLFTLSEGRGLAALGLKPGEMIGRSIFDVYRGSPRILDFAARALSGEHVSVINEVGGLWFDTQATPLYDTNGTFVGSIGVATDITEIKRAESEVHRSEERLFGILSLASEAFISIDSAQQITLFNKTAEKIFGYKPEEVIGAHLDKLLPDLFSDPQFPSAENFRFSAASTHDIITGRLIKGRRMDGTEFPALASVSQLEIGNDRIFTVMLRDMTEELRTREQLEKLSLAVEQGPGIVMITDTSGNIEYVNPKFTRISGYTLDEMLGKNPRMLKSGITSDEDYRSLWEAITSGHEWRGELHNKAKDGHLYWVSASISPMKNSHGVITHYIGVQEDITDRKETEAALARRTEELETIDRIVKIVNREFELGDLIGSILHQGMMILPRAEKALVFIGNKSDLSYRVVSSIGYDEELVRNLECTRDEMTRRYTESSDEVAKGIFLLKHRENLPGEEMLRSFPAAASIMIMTVDWESAGERFDGYLVFDSLTDVDAFDPSDALNMNRFREHAILALAKASAIQTLKEKHEEVLRTQEQLVAQQKLASLGKLTAGIAHEIMNPLNFVKNFSSLSVELAVELQDILLRAKGSRAAVDVDDVLSMIDVLRLNISKIMEHGDRANSIISNMMMHARGQGGERSSVNINRLVDAAVRLAGSGQREAAQEVPVTIETIYDPDAGELEVLPQEISRVVLNLVSNAIYAARTPSSPSPGLDARNGSGHLPSVIVSTERSEQSVMIRIRDNGSGVPMEIREKIFQPFFTTKPAGEGTGLGLSLSHDIIVEGHRGMLTLDESTPAGSTFVISLPVKNHFPA